jgi:hypothetical protein
LGVASLSVVVGFIELTPQQQIDALQVDIQTLIDAGRLGRGLGRALIAELQLAENQFDRDRVRATIVLLQAFEVSVRSVIGLRKLSKDDGQPLIDKAGAVATALSGAPGG